MEKPTGHKHSHTSELGCESPWGWRDAKQVLDAAATELTKRSAGNKQLNSVDVAESLRLGFNIAWK